MSAEFSHLPVLRSACDLDLRILLGAVVLGGFIATVGLLGWRYLHEKWAAKTSKSAHRPMSPESRHAERDPTSH